MSFTVVIVGRPNVGKSTLFNRLVGKRLALVDDTPGLTRDRREGEARLGPLDFRVIDTAGLADESEASLEGRMRLQTEAALLEADLALMVIDARAGVTPLDAHFARWLQRHETPIVLVANKAERRDVGVVLAEAHGLGLGEPVAVSAAHGEGLVELHDAIAAVQPEGGDGRRENDPDAPLRLAVLGRPNAGKSTLINHLLGRDRMLTGPEPGITRDAISLDWRWRNRRIRLVDTAGLRRRARVSDRLEKLSREDAIRAMGFAEIVVLLTDAAAPLERQDLVIARQILDEGRALVVGLSKWDLIGDRAGALRLAVDRSQRSISQARGLSLCPVSGLTGEGVEGLMAEIVRVHERWCRRLPTARLNQWLEEMIARHPPPLSPGGRRVRLRYMTQPKARPPTFAIFTNRPAELPDSYLRFLGNGLRDAFDLDGVPLRLNLRRGANPYA